MAASKADRMARIARVRTLQKRMALAQEGAALGQVNQLRDMGERIDNLRRLHAPGTDQNSSFAMKSMAHQYDRLGNALATTRDRIAKAEAYLDVARAGTLDAHQRKRAADELADRAERADAIETERRAERNRPPRRR